jgi:hypothetical protein
MLRDQRSLVIDTPNDDGHGWLRNPLRLVQLGYRRSKRRKEIIS